MASLTGSSSSLAPFGGAPLASSDRSLARAARFWRFSCLAVALFSSTLSACSSEEKPPRSSSYSDGTSTSPSTPFRELPGDGNEEASTGTSTRERAQPDSERVQDGPVGVIGGGPRPTPDGGAGGGATSDAAADSGADAGAN
jgi:hypothetical protein